ncbi:unnamed protein product [marine sediment metagenome]|uniref:Uncharacterized protein n=1 Tax=marine sediment metagenome TaxID=412755 RepID=X1KAM1_9ZZZZ
MLALSIERFTPAILLTILDVPSLRGLDSMVDSRTFVGGEKRDRDFLFLWLDVSSGERILS